MRLNVSLKRAGDGFVLDCTSQRSHKTSRLSAQTARSALPPPALRISLTGPCPCGSYGPSVTTLSPLLNEVIGLYLAQLTFDAVEDDTPYLFHPQRDTRRCVVSSQWSAMVSSTFKKHAGKAVSPKSLRSSFARAEAIEPSLPSTESV